VGVGWDTTPAYLKSWGKWEGGDTALSSPPGGECGPGESIPDRDGTT
jgi:hypothetical protein